MDDVGLWKSRVGGVLRAELIDRSLKAQTDVVLLNGGGDGEIDDGLRHRGIYKLYRSTAEQISIAVEDDVAAAEVDAAEDDGFGGCATDLKISRTANAKSAADEIN